MRHTQYLSNDAPYLLTVSPEGEMRDILEWCVENVRARWNHSALMLMMVGFTKPATGSFYIWFEDESDAVLFRLRWGGEILRLPSAAQ